MTRTIDTLGQAARHSMLLRVECRACEHTGFHKAHELAQVVGYGVSIDAVRFVCSRCGAKNARAAPIEFDYDRPPRVTVWVPVRLRR